MSKKSLQIQQLDNRISSYLGLQRVIPPAGWVHSVRTALGMSLQQLGNRLAITKQSVLDIERREKEGSITIKSLKQVADALDMKLVYGFIPNDGSLDALVDRKAKDLARQIVMRTSNTMKLEDQENSQQRIEKAIHERAAIIKNEMPKILWD